MDQRTQCTFVRHITRDERAKASAESMQALLGGLSESWHSLQFGAGGDSSHAHQSGGSDASQTAGVGLGKCPGWGDSVHRVDVNGVQERMSRWNVSVV
mmetsp:Transcript_13870/g.33931  ORF Transcript_13870/g.33931 Transcript_13870/m.33931 type:complete len:98 (+) Transcript_13870:325-618(+)